MGTTISSRTAATLFAFTGVACSACAEIVPPGTLDARFHLQAGTQIACADIACSRHETTTTDSQAVCCTRTIVSIAYLIETNPAKVGNLGTSTSIIMDGAKARSDDCGRDGSLSCLAHCVTIDLNPSRMTPSGLSDPLNPVTRRRHRPD